MAAGALSVKIGKRPRDLLNPKAVKYMQTIFSIKDTIGKKETRETSAFCGITVTQVRDYFSSQRSNVRKLVRLSHEKATKCDESKTAVDECSVSPLQSVPPGEDIPVSTSYFIAVGDCTQIPRNSGNVTSPCTQSPPIPKNAISVCTQLHGNPSNSTLVCPQVPGNLGNVASVCTQVPVYPGNFTTVCAQVPGNFGNISTVSTPVPANSGNITNVFTPTLGYPGIVTANGTVVAGSILNVTPVQDVQLAPTKTILRPVEEGPSKSSQEETTPGVDSEDKKFLDNIFNLMRKEQTFSGREKLMEWVLQIHNSAVLSWFSTKGGITSLAGWLSEAALEEQTTVLLIIFKVLCHLPLNKAQPVQMSDILKTVNKLQFYRSSDISNRAKVLLARWSNMFFNSQSQKNSRNSLKNGQKEMIRNKQRTNEVLGDKSWQSKLGTPEEILALAESAGDSREPEPKKGLKLLTDSSDGSSRKHGGDVSATKIKEHRKVLLVEHPDSKAGRSPPTARAVPSNNSRPMSADDIQKARMRASFMQDKYGMNNSPASENIPQKIEGLKALPASLPENRKPQLTQMRTNEIKKFPMPTMRSLPINEATIQPLSAPTEPPTTQPGGGTSAILVDAIVTSTIMAISAPAEQVEVAALPLTEMPVVPEEADTNISAGHPAPTVDEVRTPSSDLPSDLAEELLQNFIHNFHSNLQKCVSFLLKSIKSPFAPLKIMLVRSMDNIRDAGGVEQAKVLEQLVADFEKDIIEWHQLKQADLTPWIEEELTQLTTKMERQRAGARSQVDEITKRIQDIQTKKGEVNLDYDLTQTRVNVTVEDMAKAHAMIEKANKMILQAQLILNKAGPLRDADINHLIELDTAKATLQEQEQQALQELTIAEAKLKAAINIVEEQLKQEAAINAAKTKEQFLGSLEDRIKMYAKPRL